MIDEPEPSLTIAVLTFRRAHDLAEVLPMLVEQAEKNSAACSTIRILVVDNDPQQSAGPKVRAVAAGSSAEIVYVSETTPGISAARNRALAESNGSRLLVFIDDDERPTPDWLHLLLGTWRSTGAAAVVGPVISEFAGELDPWIIAGGFFRRRRLATGTAVSVAGTNNLLLDLEFTRAHALTFDLELGLSGGEDTLFTRQLVAAGAALVWCDEAIVVDSVPPQRMSRRWVLFRAMSSGNSWSVTSVKLAGSPLARAAVRVRLTTQGGVRVAGGAVQWLAGAVLRRTGPRARGIRTMARGIGMVGGAWGYRYLEYGRVGTARNDGPATGA